MTICPLFNCSISDSVNLELKGNEKSEKLKEKIKYKKKITFLSLLSIQQMNIV